MGTNSLETTPRVSILMTAFNREKYIAEAIESVLASTYQNWELIIVDDCSLDKTVSIARDYEQKDKRVRVFKNDKNKGQFGNRNEAARHAKGKYIKYFDSDDVLYSNTLQIMVDSMERFPEAGAGSRSMVGLSNRELPVLFSSRECYINHFFKGSDLLYVGPSGTIMNRQLFEELGRFNENSGILADTLLLLQIAAITPVVGLEVDLFFWRRHDEQVTENQKKIYEMIVERYNINQTVLNSPDCPFNANEREIIKRNLKNLLVRNFPGIILKIPIKKSLKIIRMAELNILDIFKAVVPNKKFYV